MNKSVVWKNVGLKLSVTYGFLQKSMWKLVIQVYVNYTESVFLFEINKNHQFSVRFYWMK